MKNVRSVAILGLVSCCGLATAQPVVDGAKDASYGAIQWVQNIPTGFGDNVPPPSCDENNVGNPGAVTTGIEFKIPLAAIGNPSAGDIKIAGFVTDGGYGFMSNQIIGGLPAGSANLGESRVVNLNSVAGNQWRGGIGSSGTAPVVDGTLDASYGTALFTQTCRTGFGNSDTGSTTNANGSEIDGLYAVVVGNDLYVMITGNMESNFNKLSLLIDSIAGGQNTMAGDNPDVDFNGLNRLGTGNEGPGLTFDTGFAADYFINMTNGGDAPNTTIYANYARLRPDANDPGEGYYLGSHVNGAGPTLSGGNNPNGIEIEINNSNTAGVDGPCPPPAGDRNTAVGSEIDGVFARADGAILSVLVTGNLQTTYNKIDLFFDVNSGGQQQLRGDNVDIDFNGLNRMGAGSQGNGINWDAGFAPDHWIAFTNGGTNPNVQVFANAATLRTDGPLYNLDNFKIDYGAYDGGAKATNDPIPFDGPRLDIQNNTLGNVFTEFSPREAQLEVFNNPSSPAPTAGLTKLSIDNSNIAGVTGTDASGAAAVTTGLEIQVSLWELGWDGVSPIKLAGFINNGGHSFVSNQVIGGLPTGTGNLGEPRTLNFATIAGDQFITLNVSPCAGDFNSDGVVDFFDYLDFVARFSANDTRADFNRDGVIDFFDYLDFVAAFSSCS
ncbi:MAG: hypothetical protein KGS45_04615 [Planctomycetes bacterium]|nr:hypothetical protein [Planctomycetota bacterium]